MMEESGHFDSATSISLHIDPPNDRDDSEVDSATEDAGEIDNLSARQLNTPAQVSLAIGCLPTNIYLDFSFKSSYKTEASMKCIPNFIPWAQQTSLYNKLF